MRRVGVIGLGPMGLALVSSLVRSGHPVCGFDLSADAQMTASQLGAELATSPRDVATRSDVVITFLPGPVEVIDVALAPDDGVLAGLAPGAAMLDMSTCGPDVAVLLGERFSAVGRRFIDCPVSRKAPNMTVLVGGAPGDLGADADVVAQVARSVIFCGHPGAGYAVKLLNQQVKYSWYLAAAEALLIAEAIGIDPALAADAIEQCSGGDSGLGAAASYFRGDTDFVRSRAPATTIEKDMLLAEKMATMAGVQSRTVGIVADFFLAVGQTRYRNQPYPQSSELLRTFRKRTSRPSIKRGTTGGDASSTDRR